MKLSFWSFAKRIEIRMAIYLFITGMFFIFTNTLQAPVYKPITDVLSSYHLGVSTVVVCFLHLYGLILENKTVRAAACISHITLLLWMAWAFLSHGIYWPVVTFLFFIELLSHPLLVSVGLKEDEVNLWKPR